MEKLQTCHLQANGDIKIKNGNDAMNAINMCDRTTRGFYNDEFVDAVNVEIHIVGK